MLTEMDGVSGSKQGRPTGRADGLHIIVVKHDAVIGQGVDVGGGNLVGAMEADVIPTLEGSKVWLILACPLFYCQIKVLQDYDTMFWNTRTTGLGIWLTVEHVNCPCTFISCCGDDIILPILKHISYGVSWI